MFNELLTRPVTESGFNTINPKIDEDKRKYIYFEGNKIIPIEGRETDANRTYTEGKVSINLFISYFEPINNRVFLRTEQKINLSGVKRIYVKWIVELNGYPEESVSLEVSTAGPTPIKFVKITSDIKTPEYNYLDLYDFNSSIFTSNIDHPFHYVQVRLDNDSTSGNNVSASVYELFLEY